MINYENSDAWKIIRLLILHGTPTWNKIVLDPFLSYNIHIQPDFQPLLPTANAFTLLCHALIIFILGSNFNLISSFDSAPSIQPRNTPIELSD